MIEEISFSINGQEEIMIDYCSGCLWKSVLCWEMDCITNLSEPSLREIIFEVSQHIMNFTDTVHWETTGKCVLNDKLFTFYFQNFKLIELKNSRLFPKPG